MNTVTAGPAPVLADYDVILVNSSAGKDSQASLDVVARLAQRAGVAHRVVVVHADLGQVEWEGTRELAEEQAAHYGFRFIVCSRPQGDLLQQVENRGMWPSSAARYCTSDHKRGQVRKVMTQLATEVREAGVTDRPVRILNVMGFRAEESSARAKRVAYAPATSASNGKRQVDDWYPIHKWTTAMVWGRIKESGVRYHEAYDLGMTRLSCRFCVLASKDDLVCSAKANPALAQRYADLEEKIGHRFTLALSMAEIIEAANTTTLVWSDGAARTATHLYRLVNEGGTWAAQQRGLRGSWTALGTGSRQEAQALAEAHAAKRAK